MYFKIWPKVFYLPEIQILDAYIFQDIVSKTGIFYKKCLFGGHFSQNPKHLK